MSVCLSVAAAQFAALLQHHPTSPHVLRLLACAQMQVRSTLCLACRPFGLTSLSLFASRSVCLIWPSRRLPCCAKWVSLSNRRCVKPRPVTSFLVSVRACTARSIHSRLDGRVRVDRQSARQSGRIARVRERGEGKNTFKKKMRSFFCAAWHFLCWRWITDAPRLGRPWRCTAIRADADCAPCISSIECARARAPARPTFDDDDARARDRRCSCRRGTHLLCCCVARFSFSWRDRNARSR